MNYAWKLRYIPHPNRYFWWLVFGQLSDSKNIVILMNIILDYFMKIFETIFSHWSFLVKNMQPRVHFWSDLLRLSQRDLFDLPACHPYFVNISISDPSTRRVNRCWIWRKYFVLKAELFSLHVRKFLIVLDLTILNQI